ncbi:hypothetical protein NEAUS04_2187 [Nematocida ausubeli]|uniref:Uncharacterized protein n=1 Tax=Nematocida ausubeli (strain ATCC PRA-371 / ERTm2) TaxID=1913371 RepID=A0A086J0I2_NEMA1|nr:uncharacterized protein NESG_01628 [Nematocida ausubeli]KAI5150302.1 hypothetical protein NEAUS05_2118 [Nematocida ausubeli]KAI5163975.1 hypothetical protein NEAUS04_1860 [Nematocida ausubeli]KAI5164410.1 hypothetical protein NEAUS04_2187 [Nematocida ausubeli]KFG25650.1 hypothetical protein NESG_01628 [Nematocida ausubeli]
MNMEMKQHEYLYERNNRQISIKMLVKVLLISALLAVQNVFGLLSRQCADNVLEIVLSKYKGNSSMTKIIKSFPPYMLYISGRTGILHNKRLTYPHIRIDFSAPKTKNSSQKIDRANDTVKEKDSDGNEIPKSTVEYYNTLINMFPSPDGEISIYSKEGYEDSFTSFLKSENVQEYSHRILAALLLQSEGIHVPLEIKENGNKYPELVYTNPRKPKESFSLPICTTIEQESTSEESLKKFDSRVLQTIKYFLNTKPKPKIKKNIMAKESKEKEMAWRHKFTETPAWLIQSYICHYLETKEDAIEFYDEIANQMKVYMEKFAEKVKNTISTKLFRQSFTCEDALSEEIKWWNKVNQLKDMVENSQDIQVLPFVNISQLPTKAATRISFHENIQLKDGVIPSDIESVVLTLLCCFGYDEKTKKYNFDHLPCLLEEVKDLFSMSSVSNPSSSHTSSIQVGQEISQDILARWSEIIRSLVKGDRDISYTTIEGGYVIQPDIFNILIIMLNLTGIGCNAYKKEIEKYRGRLQAQIFVGGHLLMGSFEMEIAGYAKKIFSQMSREFLGTKIIKDWHELVSYASSNDENGKEMGVFFKNYDIQTMNNTKYFTGDLEIHYGTKNQVQRIIIRFVSLEKIQLGISAFDVRLNSLMISMLKNEIIDMPKNSYNMYALFKYAENLLRSSNPGDF